MSTECEYEPLEIKTMWRVIHDKSASCWSFVFIFQVQNLNNIMAFPLENVLKSEIRDSRLVSLHFSRDIHFRLIMQSVSVL